MERDWSARDQSSDAAIEGDIEAASMFSIIAVFSMICMMAETLAWPVAWRCARLERTSATCARQIASLASSRSEEHTSELQSLMRISYAVFCLKTKKNTHQRISELKRARVKCEQ